MPPPRFARPTLHVTFAAVAVLGVLAGCGTPRTAPVTLRWIVGSSPPPFDPGGPPEPIRNAIERCLTRGLVREDSSGAAVPDVAEKVDVTPDGLIYRFTLAAGLRFADGTPCRAADFVRTFRSGLVRRDHGTTAWALSAVRGVSAIRPGKPLPELGLHAVDERTLEIELVRRDPALLARLAVPGVSTVWSEASFGLGPFRVLERTAARLELARIRAAGAPLPDTIEIRFVPSSGRVRGVLRQQGADLVWPLPPGFETETAPAGYRRQAGPARPARQLALIQRADRPPTSRPSARQALVHGINRDDLLVLLGPEAVRTTTWAVGTPAVSFPRLDPEEIRMWKQRGKLGRSFHVNLAYRGDGPADAIARTMQGEWAANDIYVDLVPLRGARWIAESLDGKAHLLLVERQPPLEDPGADLACLVHPERGPAAGSFRTGWRTREFDPLIAGAGRGPTPRQVATRLEQEMIVLPIAGLPWVWIEREGGPTIGLDPRYGPSGQMRPAR